MTTVASEAPSLETPASKTIGQVAEGLKGFLSPREDKDKESEPNAPVGEDPKDSALDEEESFEESDEGSEDESANDEPFVPITFDVDGETIELGSLDEVRNGYLRHADYTRKTQAHAEQVRTWQQQAQAAEHQLAQAAQRYAHRLQLVEQQLAEVPEPDWEKLGPEETKQAFAAWRQHQNDLNTLRQEREQTQAALSEQQRRDHAAVLGRERELLLSAKPEWKNDEVKNRDFQAISQYMIDNGFSAEEIAQVIDHRFFRVLHDAARFSEFDRTAPKPVKKTKAAPPGTGRAASPNKRTKQRRGQLRKSGKLQDAAAALKDILPR